MCKIWAAGDPHGRQAVTAALQMSVSLCSRINDNTEIASIEEASVVYTKLVEAFPHHASVFEHQARPLVDISDATHTDALGNMWTGNFRGFVQYRYDVAGHRAGSRTS